MNFIDQDKFIHKDILLDNSDIFLKEYGNITNFFRVTDIIPYTTLYPEHLYDDRLNKNDKWDISPFLYKGKWLFKKSHPCKKSLAFLRSLDHIHVATYSVLRPGAKIYPHVGEDKGKDVYRVHLPIIIPKDSKNCWIKVNGQKKSWKTGELLIFDDKIEHEVHNDTEEERVIILMDFTTAAFDSI
tara:strand:+ start:93 stop:647 length:555 start_codon:yes stop_codon:yes gene_type:complete